MAALCASAQPFGDVQSSSGGAGASKAQPFGDVQSTSAANKEDLANRLAALELTVQDYKEGRASSYPRKWQVVKQLDDGAKQFSCLTLNLEADIAKNTASLAGKRDPRARPGADVGGCDVATDQVLKHGPDIVCLQEMQRCPREDSGCEWCALRRCRWNHAERVHGRLRSEGYGGDYKRDGKKLTVGVYYKESVFEKIHIGFVTFDKPQFVCGACGGRDGDLVSSQKGAILALLRHRNSSTCVLVASVHLDVPIVNGVPSTTQQVAGLKQLRKKMEELLTHPKNVNVGTTLDTPCLAVGDFNTLSYRHWDPAIAAPDAYFEMTRTNARTAGGRGLLFKSAYARVCGTEPPYTSVAPDFLHAIDYCFYTPRMLSPTAVLAVVDDRKNLPAAPWPSDHLPLIARFELRDAPDPTTPASALVCKFGDQCLFHAKGKCRNFHPPKLPLRARHVNTLQQQQ